MKLETFSKAALVSFLLSSPGVQAKEADLILISKNELIQMIRQEISKVDSEPKTNEEEIVFAEVDEELLRSASATLQTQYDD